MTFQIRPFEPSDESAVIDLWRRCDLIRPWNDPFQDIRRKSQLQSESFLVGVLHREIIASVMAGYDGHRGLLSYVAVSPEHQRHGYGRLIVSEAERLLRAAGCPKINLHVRTSNAGVIPFYERLGYALDEVVCMGKRLALEESQHVLDGNRSRATTSCSPGRVAGIDFGSVRIGIALSDVEQSIASPYETYTRRGEASDRERFARLTREEQIERFVVGLPVHLDGRESAKSIEARQFGTWLEGATGVPVEYFDERFTTREAEQYLSGVGLSKKKRQARLDKLAAQIMLAAYLEGRRADPHSPVQPPRGLDD